MVETGFLIFAADNLTNPQNPGFLPAEDKTYRSDLNKGDQITWNGGGESAFVKVQDPTNGTFDEAQSNQTLKDPVTFDGVSYNSGQIVTPTYTLVFEGSDGNEYIMTSFNFSANTNLEVPDAVFWEGNIPPPNTVLTVTAEINPTGSTSRDYDDFVACFCAGTLIETHAGPKRVEDLTAQDRLLSQRNCFETIVLVCRRAILPSELDANPKLRPVVISKGALGNGLPVQDLRVSRQHRLYVSSPICQRMFGADEVLVSATQLTQLPGIYVDTDVSEVTYFHVLLDKHDVIFANGAPAESLYLGGNAVDALSADAREEIHAIFPELIEKRVQPKPAHFIPIPKDQRMLVARHAKNAKPVLP